MVASEPVYLWADNSLNCQHGQEIKKVSCNEHTHTHAYITTYIVQESWNQDEAIQ